MRGMKLRNVSETLNSRKFIVGRYKPLWYGNAVLWSLCFYFLLARSLVGGCSLEHYRLFQTASKFVHVIKGTSRV